MSFTALLAFRLNSCFHHWAEKYNRSPSEVKFLSVRSFTASFPLCKIIQTRLKQHKSLVVWLKFILSLQSKKWKYSCSSVVVLSWAAVNHRVIKLASVGLAGCVRVQFGCFCRWLIYSRKRSPAGVFKCPLNPPTQTPRAHTEQR